MADGEDPVGAGHGGGGEYAGQPGPRGAGAAGDVGDVEFVEHQLEGTADLVPPRVRLGQLAGQPVQHPYVQDESVHLLVQHRELRPVEPIERHVGRRLPVPERRDRAREPGVGGGLDVHLDALAPGRAPGDRHVGRPRLDSLDRRAVRGVRQPFRESR
ncbi:hypothetical protein [Micromonospora sp. NPDC048830]|uniref:hypothetical protein n=1 Tax=Micromonospora sp. NPDC048830 TaxID=3364257 RepID=UPI0037220326